MSNQEKLDIIIFIYVKCWQNGKTFRRVYHTRFPNRSTHSEKIFSKLVKNLNESRSFVRKRRVFEPRTARDEDYSMAVLASIFINSYISICQLDRMWHFTFINTMNSKKNKLHLYKVHLNQILIPQDFNNLYNFLS